MSIPLVQKYRIARYLIGRKLRGEKRFPLVLMLEPLFQCNLRCPGCGKTAHGDEVLERRLGLEECLEAVEQCGAPVVSIAGGEPLLHDQMPQIAAAITARKKFVYLCTNGLLLPRNLGRFAPSPYLTFSVHLDGDRDRHDASVGRPGTFDRAVRAIRMASARGYRVTVNCTLFRGQDARDVARFFDFVTGLGVEGITVSPAFRYERANESDAFLGRSESKVLFRETLRLGRGRQWVFNQSGLFLDFLAGNRSYSCSPWGNPTRNVFGWQKPCYLLDEQGHASSFGELMRETDWGRCGPGRNKKCAQCMMHCGFEATAVEDAVSHPWRALRVALAGPRTAGPVASDLPPLSSASQAGRQGRKERNMPQMENSSLGSAASPNTRAATARK